MMRPPLVAVLSLLAWAATASAECSWIMWWGDRSPWQPVRAYSTLKDLRRGSPSRHITYRMDVSPQHRGHARA